MLHNSMSEMNLPMFVDVERSGFGESSYPDIGRLEPRQRQYRAPL